MGKGKTAGKKPAGKLDLEELVPVYVPSLLELLQAAEQKKGGPLSEAEVVAMRDSATVVMLRRERAQEMARTRAVADLDPANVWEEWQKRRSAGQ